MTGERQPIAQQGVWEIPEQAQTAEIGAYYSAKVSAGEAGKTVTVYIRKEKNRFKVVGIERIW